MRRLALVTAWLSGGHAVAAGLYWLLLEVPESNALMLVASVAVLVLLVIVAILTETTAMAAMGETGVATWRDRLRTPGFVRRATAFIVAAAIFGAIWWLTGRASAWWLQRTGEIDAVLMLRLGWTRTSSLHASVRWALLFLRYLVGLSMALTAMKRSMDGSLTIAVLIGSITPSRLVEIAVCLVLFFLLPWRVVWWRPRAIPPTWTEPVFVAVKLGVLYVLANFGWALILRTTRPRAPVT